MTGAATGTALRAAAAILVAAGASHGVAAAEDAAPAAGAAPRAAVSLRAERWVGWPGAPGGPARLEWEEGGEPRFVGGEPSPGTRVLHAAVATPGFLDAWTRARGADAAEDPRPFGFGLRAADGADPWEPGAEAALRAGVVARRVLASPRNPGGGAPCLLAPPAGPLGAAVRHEEDRGVFSFAAAAARRERHPGSPAGLFRAFDAAVEEVRGSRAPFAGADPALAWDDGDRRALGALMATGTGTALLHATTETEIREALRWSRLAGLRPVIVGPRCGAARVLAAAAAAEVDARALGVVVALDVDDPLPRLRAPGELARAGVSVRFGTDGPDRPPGALRVAAALAVRHGMEPAAALAALGGAEAAAFAPGAVLLDGDPLDPASRVVAVVRGGVVVYEAPAPRPRTAAGARR